MNNERQEAQMREAFHEQAQRILAAPDRFRKTGDRVKIGLESEVAIFSEHTALADLEVQRNTILHDVAEFADVELGAAQIELRTPPFDILATHGFEDLCGVHKENMTALVAAARKQNVGILRIGSNPFLPVQNTPRTDKPKYRLIQNYHNHHRSPDIDTVIGLGKHRVDIGDAAVCALFQSFQVNMEAYSFEDACDKMNRSLMIAPYLLALSANSRYLEFLDTRVQDVRMLAWEKSHDTRIQDLRLLSWEKAFDIRTRREISTGRFSRVGLPERYFRNLGDYLTRAGSFPFILHQPGAALGIAIGLTWLDTRVKFIDDSLVVELRLLPTQPTIEEEMLLTLLYIGRLVEAQAQNEKILPIEYVRENRLSAMLYGMHRHMWFMPDDGSPKWLPYKIGMRREIQKAGRGLDRIGLAILLDKTLIKSILANGSPSDRLAKSLRNNKCRNLRDCMKEALEETKMLVR